MRSSWLTLFLLLACSCGGTGAGELWDVSVDTLAAGTVRVVNVPPSTDDTRWRVRETARVGALDGDGPEVFGELRGLVVLPDGGFAVLDAIAQEVRVFDPGGEHRATLGSEGEGPGELSQAFGLMGRPDGTLWVPDHANARMSVFDAERGFLRSYPLRLLLRRFVWSGALMSDGRLWKPSITLTEPRRNVMRVYGPAMELLDSLPLPDDPEADPEDPPGAFYWEAPGGMPRGYYSVPFYPQGERLLDPRGVVWSTASGDPGYRIAQWEPGGDTLLVLETRRPPVPIPASERDSAIATIREELRQRGGASQDWSKVPLVRPAVSMMFLSDEGDLWVMTELADGASVFDVYARDGTHRRTVSNPLDLYRWVPPVVRGDELWGIVTDALGVDYVVRARIEPAAPS